MSVIDQIISDLHEEADVLLVRIDDQAAEIRLLMEALALAAEGYPHD